MGDQDGRLGVRLSSALRERVDRVGDTSAATRALLILGLRAAGIDISRFRAEGAAVLDKLGDAQVKFALEAVLFNKGSTNVQHLLNGLLDAPPMAGASMEGAQSAMDADDPLGGVGIDV